MDAKYFLGFVLAVWTSLLSAGAADEGLTGFEEALNIVHTGVGREDHHQSVMAAADELRARQPESGFGEVIVAEYLSTFLLGDDGEPREIFDEIVRLSEVAITLNPNLAQAYIPNHKLQPIKRVRFFSQ